MRNNQVAIIIPTLSNTVGLKNLLIDLQAQSLRSNIVIIDNAPDQYKQQLVTKYQNVTYLPQAHNIGFAVAINLGYQVQPDADYLLMINDDIRIPDEDLIKKLIQFAENEELAAAAPLLINPNQKAENIGYFLDQKGKVILNHDPAIRFSRDEDIFSRCDLAGLTAAFLLIKTSAFRDVGGFDEKFFAYLEDVDLSLRLKNAGYHLGIATDLKVLHQHSVTSKSMGYFKQKQDYLNWHRIIWRHWSIKNKIQYFFPITIERLRNLNGLLKKYYQHNQLWQKILLRSSYACIVAKKFFKNLTNHRKLLQKIASLNFENIKFEAKYQKWIQNVEQPWKHSKVFSSFDYRPKISVLVPVYNVAREHLTACIESVIAQTYDNWELCLVDDASTMACVRQTLEKYKDHPRIKIKYRRQNGHISRSSNDALAMATGEFVAFLDCDDVLDRDAFNYIVEKLNENHHYDWIYTDEDKVDENGQNRQAVHFKSDWSPDTLMSHMYTCHLSVYRRSLIQEVGCLRVGFEGSQDYDLALRLAEVIQPSKIAHVPQVLYHWRQRPESTAGNSDAKPYVYEAAKKAKLEALTRRSVKGELQFVEKINQFQVNYQVQGQPLVSIIIPSKDNFPFLDRCINSLREKTRYQNFEVITVDNGSSPENKKMYRDFLAKKNYTYLYKKHDFNFSWMCNVGAMAAKGDFLLFLNDDAQIIDGSWLEKMLGYAQLDHVGAVGVKLLYPDGHTIQHCGIHINATGPVNTLMHQDDRQVQYFSRNRLAYNVLAVSGACLLVSRKKFEEVSGFDESFPVAYNDVDLGVKLYKQGYFNVNLGNVSLLHHESVSRGNDQGNPDKKARLERELARFYERYPDLVGRDLFNNYNINYIGY